MLRETKAKPYPWSIRTFFAFAATGEILLDLVILEIFRERR